MDGDVCIIFVPEPRQHFLESNGASETFYVWICWQEKIIQVIDIKNYKYTIYSNRFESMMTHRTFSRKGGRVRSAAKTAANRAKVVSYWKEVRAGLRPAPRRRRVPPDPGLVGQILGDYCRQSGIIRLEVFGSSARGEARRGSDIDLLATFSSNPGLRFFAMEGEMSDILGVPVHLLTRESVEQMSNPFRRASILADARVIYHV
jgi:predicted nucleotidyltransferase